MVALEESVQGVCDGPNYFGTTYVGVCHIPGCQVSFSNSAKLCPLFKRTASNETGGGDKPASGGSAGSTDAAQRTAKADRDDDTNKSAAENGDAAGERRRAEGSDDNQVSILLSVW